LTHHEEDGDGKSIDIVKTTDEFMNEAEKTYLQRRPLKWVVAAIFTLGGLIFGYWAPFLIAKVTSASYERAGMDKIMKEELGDFKFSEALSHELLVFAYAYNE
jgi:hypothetical protein